MHCSQIPQSLCIIPSSKPRSFTPHTPASQKCTFLSPTCAHPCMPPYLLLLPLPPHASPPTPPPCTLLCPLTPPFTVSLLLPTPFLSLGFSSVLHLNLSLSLPSASLSLLFPSPHLFELLLLLVVLLKLFPLSSWPEPAHVAQECREALFRSLAPCLREISDSSSFVK